MEIDITFSCKCGAFIDEVVYCDGPEISATTDKESLCEYWTTVRCDGCNKEYDANIISRMSETDIHIPEVIDLTFDVRDHIDEEDITSEIESTHQLKIYQKVSTDIISLLRHPHPEELKATLNNMLFAQVVTTLEAYLSSSFISTVVNSEELIRRLVETDPELAKRQFSLKEIFTQWEELKLLVARYLKDLIFHDIKKIKPMYSSVLDFNFGDTSWLFKAILIRHDCVHRNGFNKDGIQHQIDSESIIELVRQCTRLVSKIEEHLSERHNT